MGGARRCAACGAGAGEGEGAPRDFMARFPLDVNRCKEWVKAVGDADLVDVPIESLHRLRYVCSDHFSEKDINRKRNKLKKKAVPSLNLRAPLADEQLLEFPVQIPWNHNNSGVGPSASGIVESEPEETMETGRSVDEEWSWPCHLCLSTERVLSCARDVSWAYGVITEQDQSAGGECEEAQVCWECKAELRRMLRFKRQALRARQLLEQVRIQPTHTQPLPLQCLSQLTITTKPDYDYIMSYKMQTEDCKERDISNEFMNGLQIRSCYDSNEIMPKEENDLDASDVWAEQLTEEIPIGCEEPVATNRVKQKGKRKVTKETGERTDEDSSKDFNYEKVYDSKEDVMKRRLARLQSPKFLSRHRHKCIECVEVFTTESRLAIHNRRLHCESVQAVTCDICLCRLPSVADLATHLASHQMYKCGRCPFIAPSVVKLKRHHETHARKQRRETSRSCDVCGKQFKNKQTFTVHYKLHAKEQPYECDHCHKIYKTRIQIFRHLKSHRKRWLCDMCGKTFSNKTYLDLHSFAHADPSERKFECPECNNRFIDKFKLIVHMRSHTGEKPFKCDDCEKVFREKAQLVSHRKKHHSDNDSNVVIKEKRTLERTKSAYRNKPYAVESKAKTNILDNQKDFIENIAQKRGKLKTDKQDYTCNFCGKMFKARFRLKFHLAVHTDDRPHKCSECGMNFKYQAGLWTHKLLHKGEKHQCTTCGALFTQKGNLTAHLKIHTDDKPFECNVCGNKFRTRRNLRNHLKVHLAVTSI